MKDCREKYIFLGPPERHCCGPLVLKYIQTDGSSYTGNIGMPDLSDKTDLDRYIFKIKQFEHFQCLKMRLTSKYLIKKIYFVYIFNTRRHGCISPPPPPF